MYIKESACGKKAVIDNTAETIYLRNFQGIPENSCMGSANNPKCL